MTLTEWDFTNFRFEAVGGFPETIAVSHTASFRRVRGVMGRFSAA